MMKSRFIRRKKSKSESRQTTNSEEILEPPKEFSNDQLQTGCSAVTRIQTQTEISSPTEIPEQPQTESSNVAGTTGSEVGMKTKKGNKKGGVKHKKSSQPDDYGFLSLPKGDSHNRQPRITIRARSPESEVEYFDDSLFDIGFLQTSSEKDCIPITLGSISSASTSTPASVNDNCDSEMPVKIPPVLCNPKGQRKESHYVNMDCSAVNEKNFYKEKNEGHYATLAELNSNNRQSSTSPKTTTPNELNFYVQKAAEQRARSRSRGPVSSNRGRSRSKQAHQGRSRSRGCSASRDIMALYTNRPVSACRLRKDSKSPDRDSTSHLRRRESVSPVAKNTKQSGQSKRSKRQNEAATNKLSKEENILQRKTCNTAHQTPSQSANPTSERLSTPQNSPKLNDRASFMTILEMDVEKNNRIEKDLMAANSLKPANIKMMMIAHHAPSSSWASKDEVHVKAGDIVTGIYKQSEWLFVMTDTRKMGFVPYAFTKPVKVVNNSKSQVTMQSPLPTTKPVSGILKTSNHGKQKSRKFHPKYSVKVKTAADNDSLSSESSSAIMEDFVYTRKRSNTTKYHADCIVIDTDGICSTYDSAQNGEETGTYCSDSGISDPSSNHSEDLDLLHSPCLTDDSGIHAPISTPRLLNERVVSVTTKLLANSPFNSMKNLTDSEPKSRYHGSMTISDLPLGPLGARLAKLNIQNEDTKSSSDKKEKKLDSDMRDRARCTSTTPSSVRPEIPKDYNGPRVTVVFDYEGGNDDDLVVHASDVVTVLNSEDIEWIWVQRRDGKEGFIPREYVIALELSTQNRRRIGISLL